MDFHQYMLVLILAVVACLVMIIMPIVVSVHGG